MCIIQSCIQSHKYTVDSQTPVIENVNDVISRIVITEQTTEWYMMVFCKSLLRSRLVSDFFEGSCGSHHVSQNCSYHYPSGRVCLLTWNSLMGIWHLHNSLLVIGYKLFVQYDILYFTFNNTLLLLPGMVCLLWYQYY